MLEMLEFSEKKSTMRSRTRTVILIIILVILYNEFISYYTKSWFQWPVIHCPSSQCLRILFVADPQILGERYEREFPKGSLSRWDSDRYLFKTFQLAKTHAKPHVVVFLGDIMDEGSIARKDEYERYVNRFFSIFQEDSEVKFIYIPGDNDIGGEDQPFSSEKLQRFQHSFSQQDIIKLDQAYIYKVNRISFSIPQQEKNVLKLEQNKTRIVLSHLPLLNSYSSFVQQVLDQINPQVIFSAHGHKSLHIMESDKEKLVELLSSGKNDVNHFFLNKNVLHEIIVPTCSYRMGVSNMGYGLAVIDPENFGLQYCVLWLPSRFTHIWIYLTVLILLIILILIRMCYILFTIFRHRWLRKIYRSPYIF